MLSRRLVCFYFTSLPLAHLALTCVCAIFWWSVKMSCIYACAEHGVCVDLRHAQNFHRYFRSIRIDNIYRNHVTIEKPISDPHAKEKSACSSLI